MRPMDELFTKKFFNLDQCSFSQLFEENVYVWEALENLETFFRTIKFGKIEGTVSSSAYLVHPEKIIIGKGTVVEPGAYICGPCVIGKNCEIRHGAYLRGNVLIGDGCVIGHDTEIKRSILLNEVCAAHFNYVGDSILGNKVNLGAGVKLANLRLDNHEISFIIQGEKVLTGLCKLGAIIGDHAQLGCNVVTNPGTIIGPNSFCFPCLNVGGFIPPNAKVKSTQKIMIQEYVNSSATI